ncbi:hypothetical protein [Micromonospora sp. b486]|uniref:hypothetical protein n=1 Tax=Micromonospora sp. b486 TaxID=3053986 RepID=UPI00259CE147|nr:hypothetical protein [Micromonospora sp. b486]MDM4778071.1 hypothetical protein [Micromonospora sp. b486]
MALPAAVLVGLTVTAGGLTGPGWFPAYALLGLVVPVLVLDGVPAQLAPWRAVRLAGRVSARAAAIRLLGYLGWWLIRLGIGWASTTASPCWACSTSPPGRCR